MKNIEEQLWQYIDGNCDAAEKLIIAQKIDSDLAYRTMYNELLQVNATLKNLALEEPSMSFTRNVMERVNGELKPISLKTKVDQRIIYGIAIFFLGSILSLVMYAISISKFDFSIKLPNLDFNLNQLVESNYFQIFIMVDVALVLLYIDSYIRKTKTHPQKKGS